MGSCFKWKRKQSYDVCQPDAEYTQSHGKYRTSQLLSDSTSPQSANGQPDVFFGTRSYETSSKENLGPGVTNGYDNAPTLEKRPRGYQEREIVETTTSVERDEQVKGEEKLSDVEEINLALRKPEVEISDVRVSSPGEPEGQNDAREDQEDRRSRDEEEETREISRREVAEEVHAVTVTVTETSPPNVAFTQLETEQEDYERHSLSSEENHVVQPVSHVTFGEEENEEEDFHDDRQVEREDSPLPAAKTTATVTFSGEVDIHSDHSYEGDGGQLSEAEEDSGREVVELVDEPIVYQAREPRVVSFAEPADLEETFADSPTGTWDARLNSEVRAEYEARMGSQDSMSSGDHIREDYPHHLDRDEVEDDDRRYYGDDAEADPTAAGTSVVTVTTTTYTIGDVDSPSSKTQSVGISGDRSLLDEIDDNEANERIITTRTEYHEAGDIELSGDAVQYVS